jgi:hypothetical protein
MPNKDVKHRVTITVSDKELLALEDSLIVWNLCKKHNGQTWDHKERRTKTEQEIFKMQDECEMCKRKNRLVHRKAWQVASKLFKVWDKTY